PPEFLNGLFAAVEYRRISGIETVGAAHGDAVVHRFNGFARGRFESIEILLLHRVVGRELPQGAKGFLDTRTAALIGREQLLLAADEKSTCARLHAQKIDR